MPQQASPREVQVANANAPQELTPEQREATEKLLLALRIASAKLNYAERQVQEIVAFPIHCLDITLKAVPFRTWDLAVPHVRALDAGLPRWAMKPTGPHVDTCSGDGQLDVALRSGGRKARWSIPWRYSARARACSRCQRAAPYA